MGGLNAECPKCKSQDFDVYDMDFSLIDAYVHCHCTCDNCGKVFFIKADIIVKEIK